MLRSVQRLEGLSIGATDGPIGEVKDLYFDDEAWVIRYVVADTSRWLGGREVLISPYSIGSLDWAGDTLPVTITKEQVKNSPSRDSDKPISRQYEKSYAGYYGYPYYWGSTGLWGEWNSPSALLTGGIGDPDGGYEGYLSAPTNRDSGADPHLRSCNSLKGYHILAKDGEIGHVQGYLVDDATWSIRYLILNTSNWWVGHQVLLSPEWIEDVSWADSNIIIHLDRQAIKDAPVYDDEAYLTRDAEDRIYAHYGRRGYWHERTARAVA